MKLLNIDIGLPIDWFIEFMFKRMASACAFMAYMDAFICAICAVMVSRLRICFDIVLTSADMVSIRVRIVSTFRLI